MNHDKQPRIEEYSAEPPATAQPTPAEVDYYYQTYLRIVNIEEATMPPAQCRLIKQTFYSAWGLSLAFVNDLVELPTERAADVLLGMDQQVSAFLRATTPHERADDLH